MSRITEENGLDGKLLSLIPPSLPRVAMHTEGLRVFPAPSSSLSWEEAPTHEASRGRTRAGWGMPALILSFSAASSSVPVSSSSSSSSWSRRYGLTRRRPERQKLEEVQEEEETEELREEEDGEEEGE